MRQFVANSAFGHVKRNLSTMRASFKYNRSVSIPMDFPTCERAIKHEKLMEGLQNFVLALSMKPNSIRIQYLSDVHVDSSDKIPIIKPVSDILAICGDIGKPTHPNFDAFLKHVSKQFEQIYFVPGNHDYDCGPFYDTVKVEYYEKILANICNRYSNVTLLNNSFSVIGDNTIIAGTTLWCNPVLRTNVVYDYEKHEEHLRRHYRDVQWITNLCKAQKNTNIVMLSHFVPTFKLIEQKYMSRGIHKTSAFATDLEYLIKDPIVAWLCGHTHSVTHTCINGVFCGVNAHGYKHEASNNFPSRYIDVEI